MKKLVTALVMVVSIAIPAAAADFVALVDLERGLLLIPEGTVVPAGVDFYLEADNAPARRSGPWMQDSGIEQTPAFGAAQNAAARRRLVYQYAPAEQFAAARQRIRDTRPREVETDIADLEQWYYFYFYDGSYHGARKSIRNLTGPPPSYNVSYGVQTMAFTSNGDFGTRMTVSQSSSQYSYWTVSRSCSFEGTEGSCYTPIYGYQSHANFTASVTSRASIVHYFYAPCDLPCKENLSSSIVINFP